MRDGQAEISLRLGDERYRVYALARDGSRRRKVPFVQNHETLSFTADVAADPTSATCLYEVVVRPRPLIVQIQ